MAPFFHGRKDTVPAHIAAAQLLDQLILDQFLLDIDFKRLDFVFVEFSSRRLDIVVARRWPPRP